MTLLTGHKNKHGSHLEQLEVYKDKIQSERDALDDLEVPPENTDKKNSLTREINKILDTIRYQKRMYGER